MSEIHPTAVISEGAEIGPDCSIGAYSVIGPRVVLGAGNVIASHVVIEGHTRLGDENRVFQFASVGSMPQDLKFRGEDSVVQIGDKNVIREYVTIQPGTTGGGMRTLVGDGNLFMACSHVGHDCIVGSHNIFANSVALAGHVTIGNCVIVGGLAGIHQFVRLGDYSLIGAGAMVAKDVPHYCNAQGDRACLIGINTIGLSRRGFSPPEVSSIRKLYRELFLRKGTFKQKVALLRSEYADFPAAIGMLDFIDSSERGVCAIRRSRPEGDENTDN